MLVLKQLRTLENLQGEINKNFEKRLENLNFQIKVLHRQMTLLMSTLEAAGYQPRTRDENLTKSERIT